MSSKVHFGRLERRWSDLSVLDLWNIVHDSTLSEAFTQLMLRNNTADMKMFRRDRLLSDRLVRKAWLHLKRRGDVA